jgi:hypothetical protein
MNVGETAQSLCGECQAIFSLTADGTRETEYIEGPDKPPAVFGDPICCPFCGDEDVQRTSDIPIVV